ncbi:hypothetical protein GHT06_019396 [Daphnia sinensis]|uniref:BTB/POZ domain-containing protein KCTD16 n=1 Tax=Daphnia sinensis TaxID=1820382 RepID=A0AAD5KKQ7_9CRUS|nr:hypothetical protein GHT06_019396 [Daphnia sinensis]
MHSINDKKKSFLFLPRKRKREKKMATGNGNGGTSAGSTSGSGLGSLAGSANVGTSSGNSSSSGAGLLFPSIVELNVGGVHYTTTLSTLTRDPDSLLGQMFSGRWRSGQQPVLMRDSKGKYFIDRDGVLFRYTLDFLRNQKLTLPENFHECERLKQEADYFQMAEMRTTLLAATSAANALARLPIQQPTSSDVSADENDADLIAAGDIPSPPAELAVALPRSSGYITVGYRGTFAFGRDGLADVKFRKLSRILVCGRVALCREVFGETLNESRDPDRGASDRYSCRFFLKHTFLEQAFDMLQEAGFHCVASCGSGTASAGTDIKPGMDSEENRWNHYNEFVFVRR